MKKRLINSTSDLYDTVIILFVQRSIHSHVDRNDTRLLPLSCLLPYQLLDTFMLIVLIFYVNDLLLLSYFKCILKIVNLLKLIIIIYI